MATKQKHNKKKFRVIKAWADVGSHNGIFAFAFGPVYSQYGPILHIWEKKITPDLVPVEIRVPIR